MRETLFASSGQASLETLIVLSALFAFLLAFIPVVNQARELIEFAKMVGQAQAFASRLSSDLKQAQLLGDGNAREWAFSFAGGEMEVSLTNSNVLVVSCSYAGHSKKIETVLGFPASLSGETRLAAGSFIVRVKNDYGHVEAEILKH
ncbi:MAG: hypothetical protein ACK4NX_02240 [Candidatus Paceibacteria bacterium]